MRERLFVANAARMKRSDMVKDAMAVLGLPSNTHLIYAPVVLFVNNVPPVPEWMEEHHLALIVENICWLYYLNNYTDFYEARELRREVMGDYQGLVRDVLQDYAKPSIYPWLI